jgi:hypothetical protein
MNAKPGHASYHLESQVDLQIAGDSIKGVNVRADIGALRRRWPCCHMPYIMNEEVAAGLAKPISVEKRVTSKTVELSNCLTNRLGR